jgi:hypothetical protein
MIWPDWRGSFDGRPAMWIKTLFDSLGCKLELHKFVRADDIDCFHTHPAYALRIILRGGYVEESECGTLIAWRAGDVGLVKPWTSHRVHALLCGRPAYTLWIRGPKIAAVQLRGSGWRKQSPPNP